MIVVQARMGSRRLPGKVLRPVGETTVLDLMLDRLGAADLGPVVVATSDLEVDDPIADRMANRTERLVRGSEADVLQRLSQAASTGVDEHLVRLTADCPLADAELVSAVVQTHESSGADYTSNTLLRTFPDGLDVEVIRTEALHEADARAVDPIEREHVTPYITRRPESYHLAAHAGPLDAEDERWTVDVGEDLVWLESLLSDHPDLASADWQSILERIGFQRPAPPHQLVLRVDRDGATDPSVDAIKIGASDGVEAVLHPGRRTWKVMRDTNVVGRLTVVIECGHGELSGWLERSTDVAAALGALEQRLTADVQVIELGCREINPSIVGAFTAAGFSVDPVAHPDRARRLRLPSASNQPVPNQRGANR